MPYLIQLTPQQVEALAAWADLGLSSAPVMIDLDGEAHRGRLIVGQGDARCYIDLDGSVKAA